MSEVKTPRTDALMNRHAQETRLLYESNPYAADKRNITWCEHSIRQAKELLEHAKQIETELARYQQRWSFLVWA